MALKTASVSSGGMGERMTTPEEIAKKLERRAKFLEHRGRMGFALQLKATADAIGSRSITPGCAVMDLLFDANDFSSWVDKFHAKEVRR